MAHILTEKEIAIKAIEIIKQKPGIDTSALIKELESVFILHPEDLEILDGRKDTKFSQKVRNLASHYESNFFGKKVTKGPKVGRSFTWFINNEGEELVDDTNENTLFELIKEEEENVSVNNSNEYNSDEMNRAENREPEQTTSNSRTTYKKDPRITRTYIKSVDFLCEKDNSHLTFTSKRTKENYVEGHHLIPMKAQADFNINIDRSENIVSLCPICHKKVHLGTKEERKEVLEEIYRLKIIQLQSIGISISFEDLYNKYYA